MTNGSTIRLFVSSTFTDMKAERDLLQRDVFPRLRKQCLELGLRFQAIDLRWGVSEEAGRDNRTMRICLRELRRCQSGGPKPNFLILLGDRYGWCPLPETIPADLFEKLETAVDAGNAKNRELLHSSYRRDDNAVPPAYVLQPQPREAPFDDPKAWWPKVGGPLLAALQRAVAAGGLEKEAAPLHLGISATHQEILHGALQLPKDDVRQHVHAFVRSFRLPDGKAPHKDFIDCRDDGMADLVAEARLKKLRGELETHLTDANFHPYTVDWREEGKFTEEDLKQFHDDVIKSLEGVIVAQAEANRQLTRSGDLEGDAHAAFGAERRAGHVGHTAELARAADYLVGSDARPLFVIGPAGSGKTAFIAEIAARARQIRMRPAFIIERYIGATPIASRVMPLLRDVVERIRAVYPATRSADARNEVKPEAAIPAEFNPLVTVFYEALNRVTPEKPLLLLLDALDQLADTDGDPTSTWLPTTLPAGVRLIVSIARPSVDRATDEKKPVSGIDDTVIGTSPPEMQLSLPPLDCHHGEQMLRRWLTAAGRTLQPEQRSAILSGFAVEGNPLWLRTVAAEALLWPSWEPPPKLPTTTPDLIRRMLAQFSREGEHGPALVELTLGYLACSRHGLSEDELLDLLSIKEKGNPNPVMTDFYRRFPRWKHLQSLPVATWVPLLGDLSPFLCEQAVDGVTLIRFYHRTMKETVSGGYLTDTENRRRNHRAIAAYFRALADPYRDLTWGGRSSRAFSELPWHLAQSNEIEQLLIVLRAPSYLLRKIQMRGVRAALDDFGLVQGNGTTRQVERSIALSEAVLERFPEQLFAHLYARLVDSNDKEILSILENARRSCARPWLRPISRCLEPPSTSLLRTHVLGGELTSISLSADSRFVAVGDEKERLLLWDLENGKQSRLLMAGDSNFHRKVQVAMTPDGKKAVSVSYGTGRKVWDVRTGELALSLKPAVESHEPRSLAVSPDGLFAVIANGAHAEIHCLRTGRLTGKSAIPVEHVFAVFPALNVANCVLSSYRNWIQCWNMDTGRELRRMKAETSAGFPPDVAAVSARQRLFACNGIETESVTIVDIELWKAVRTLNANDRVMAIAISDDEALVAAGRQDGRLLIWEIATGERFAEFSGHAGGICGVAFVAQGRELISASHDGTIRRWTVASSGKGQCGAIESNRTVDALSLDGKFALIRKSDREIELWDLEVKAAAATLCYDDPPEIARLQLSGEAKIDWIDTFALDPKRERLFTDGIFQGVLANADVDLAGNVKRKRGGQSRELMEWNLATGRVTRFFDNHALPELAPPTVPWHLERLPDSKKMVACYSGMTRRSSEEGLAFAPDLRFAILGVTNYNKLHGGSAEKVEGFHGLEVWDLVTGRPKFELKGHDYTVFSVALSSDGAFAVSGCSTWVIFWDIVHGTQLARFRAHDGWIADLLFSPNGAMVVTAARDKGCNLKLWHFPQGNLQCELRGFADQIAAISFSPQGDLLASCGGPCIQIWDWQGCRLVAQFVGPYAFRDCRFSRDGGIIFAIDERRSLYEFELINR